MAAASLNHRSIDLPMVPPCPSCGGIQIWFARSQSQCECLRCQHQWFYQPTNEAEDKELFESIVHLHANITYFEHCKDPAWIESELARRYAAIDKLQAEISKLYFDHDHADSKIVFCNKTIEENEKKIFERKLRTRAVSDPNQKVVESKTVKKLSAPKHKTGTMMQKIYDKLIANGVTQPEIWATLGLDYEKDELVLT